MLAENFKVSQKDIEAIIKKNHTKINKHFNSIIKKTITSLEEDFTVFSIKETVVNKENIIKSIESERVKIINEHNDEKETENKLLDYLTSFENKIKKSIEKSNTFSFNRSQIFNNNINVYDSYNEFNIILQEDPSDNNDLFLTIPIENGTIKVNNLSKIKISSTDFSEKGISHILNKNKKHFYNIINQLNIEELYKINLMRKDFFNHNKLSQHNIYNIVEKTILNGNKFKNANEFLEELQNIKDMLELNSDIKIDLPNIVIFDKIVA